MCKAIYDMVEDGRTEGRAEGIVETIDRIIENSGMTLETACALVGISVEQYEKTKERIGKSLDIFGITK